MKRSVLFLLPLFVLVSCTQYRAQERIMDQALSLMDEAPDSALSLMQGMDPSLLRGRRQHARHALLYTMAQDKDYVVETDDSLAQLSRAYYRGHGSKADRLKSLYYLGVVHHNAGLYSEAVAEFREAESLALRLEDNHHLGLIYWHLEGIYSSNYDHVRALEYAQKALAAYQAAGESLAVEYSWLDLANDYAVNGRWKEAIPILDSLMKRNEEHDALYSYAARDLANIIVTQSLPDINKALEYYEIVNNLGAIILSAREIGYIALLMERKGLSQSANDYLSIAKSFLKTPADSAVWHNTRQGVFDIRGETDSAYNSLAQAVKIQNRVVTSQLEQSISHSMETYFQDSLALERERTRFRRSVYAIIGILLLGLLFVLAETLRHRNRQILQDMATIQEVSEDLQRQRDRNMESSRIMDRFVGDKIESLQALSRAYFSWDDREMRHWDTKKGMDTREEVIARFRRQLGALRASPDFIVTLEESLNVREDGIMREARNLMGNQKDREYSLLVLLLSGFSVKSVSFLLQMSEPAVRMQKTRFKQFFASRQGKTAERIVQKLIE